MRNAAKILMIALCGVVMSGAVSAGNRVPAAPTEASQVDDTAKKTPFRVGMYRIVHSLKMNVLVEKKLGDRVTVKLMDPKGHVLFEDYIGKKQLKYGRKFDFSQVEDGNFQVIITNGDQRIVKDIRLNTFSLYEMPARTLVTLN